MKNGDAGVGAGGPGGGSSVYLTLLDVYLEPPQGQQPNVGQCVELLKNHCDKLDATLVTIS